MTNIHITYIKQTQGFLNKVYIRWQLIYNMSTIFEFFICKKGYDFTMYMEFVYKYTYIQMNKKNPDKHYVTCINDEG